MRHFSGEFEGVRLLMADELDAIAGGDGEDTDDAAVFEGDIVVNGVRIDAADREETLMERTWLLSMLNGQWANAEVGTNGVWEVRGSDTGTADQIIFKGNYDKVHETLWGNLTQAQQISLASALTDGGFNLANSNINIGVKYIEYKGLLSSGAVQGKDAADFVNWLSQNGS